MLLSKMLLRWLFVSWFGLTLMGPHEPAGFGSLPQGAMALAGVGWAWSGQLDLREGGSPEHPTWIVLVGWLDAGCASHHQIA